MFIYYKYIFFIALLPSNVHIMTKKIKNTTYNANMTNQSVDSYI